MSCSWIRKNSDNFTIDDLNSCESSYRKNENQLTVLYGSGSARLSNPSK